MFALGDQPGIELPRILKLEQHGADDPPVYDQRDAADATSLPSLEVLMGECNTWRAAVQGGVTDRSLLFDGLVHGRAKQAQQFGFADQAAAVRDGDDAGEAVFDEADGDPFAMEFGGQLRGKGCRCGG